MEVNKDNIHKGERGGTPITGSADYIENVYGTKMFAMALMVADAKSIMDLMDDFTDQQTAPLQSRIEELEAENAKYREALEGLLKINPRSLRNSTHKLMAIDKAQQALNKNDGRTMHQFPVWIKLLENGTRFIEYQDSGLNIPATVTYFIGDPSKNKEVGNE